MIKVGATEIDTIKIGTTNVDKVMLGEVEIYPNAVDCTPVTGEAADFIESPVGGFSRDGVLLTDAEQNPDGIFPDGPLPPVLSHGLGGTSSYITTAKNSSVTIGGCTSGVYENDSVVRAHVDAGIKSSFPIRDFLAGAGGVDDDHGSEPDLVIAYEGTQGDRQIFAQMIRAYMDLVLNSTVNPDMVVWGPKGDDSLECANNYYDGNTRKSCNYTDPDPAWRHFTANQIRPAFSWLQRIITAYDDPAGSFSEDGVTVPGHANGRKRGIVDIPFHNGMSSYAAAENPDRHNYVEQSQYWTHQASYWGYSPSAGARTVQGSFSLKSFYYQSFQLEQLNAYLPAAPHGNARCIVPCIRSTSYANLPSSVNTFELQKRCYRAQIIAMLIGGAHGFYFYGFHTSTYNPMGDADFWPNTSGPMKDLLDSFLWGDHKGGTKDDPIADASGDSTYGMVRRQALDGFKWSVSMLENPDMLGTSTPPPPGGGYSGSYWYNHEEDMLMWKTWVYKGKRYFVVLNGMPYEDEYNYLVGLGNYGVTTPGVPNGPVSGKANFVINTRFTFPNFGGQLKCTDYFTGDDIPMPGTGDFVTDIALDSYEHKVYVFEPADGYCGGDEPQAPSIVGPDNETGYVDGTATFTVTASGGAPYTYQWKRNDANVGTNSPSYTTEALALDDDGDLIKVVVTNDTGSTTSRTATLNVEEALVGIHPAGQYWTIDGVEKLLLGGFTGGEPHLYKQSDLVPADGSDTLTAELTTLGTANSPGGSGFIRCTLTTWGGQSNSIADFPFIGGLTTFNLTVINQTYFDRMDSLLTKAKALANAVVSFELWEPHNLPATGEWAWDGTPGNGDPDDGTAAASQYWNPKNNITYTTETSGLPESGNQSDNLTFTGPAINGDYTISAANEPHVLLKAQKLFVDAACVVFANHSNCIVQMMNESPELVAWDDFWANYINYKNLGIIVTTMRNEWDLATTDAKYAINNPAIYDYAESSQGCYPDSTLDTKHGKLIGFHGSYAKPINSVKIYSRNSSYNYDHFRAVDNMMLNIMCGNAAVAFHPGDDGEESPGLGLAPQAQRAISGARWLTDFVTLSAMTPVPLGDGRWLNRNANKAFAMSGATDVIFSFSHVDGSWFHFDFTAISAGDVNVTWYDLDVGGAAPYNETLSPNLGERVEMSPPGNSSNQWLVHVESA